MKKTNWVSLKAPGIEDPERRRSDRRRKSETLNWGELQRNLKRGCGILAGNWGEIGEGQEGETERRERLELEKGRRGSVFEG